MPFAFCFCISAAVDGETTLAAKQGRSHVEDGSGLVHTLRAPPSPTAMATSEPALGDALGTATSMGEEKAELNAQRNGGIDGDPDSLRVTATLANSFSEAASETPPGQRNDSKQATGGDGQLATSCDSSAARPPFPEELENLPTAGWAAGTCYPSAASLPVSLEIQDHSAWTLKSKHRCGPRGNGIEAAEGDMAIRALSQLVGLPKRMDLSGSLSCSTSPATDPAAQLALVPQLLPATPPGATATEPCPQGTLARASLQRLRTADPSRPAPSAPAQGPGSNLREPPRRRMTGDGGMAAAPTAAPGAAACRPVTVSGRDQAVSSAVRTSQVSRNLSLHAALSRKSAAAAAAAAAASDFPSVLGGPPNPSASAASAEEDGRSGTSPLSAGAAAAAAATAAEFATAPDAVGTAVANAASAASVGAHGSSVFTTQVAIAAVDARDGGPGPLTAPPQADATTAAAANGSKGDPGVVTRGFSRSSAPHLAAAGAGLGREGPVEGGGNGGGAGGSGAVAAVEQLPPQPPSMPAYGSAPSLMMYGSQVSKLPYQASRHLSQVAFLQMLQQQAGGGAAFGLVGPGAAAGSPAAIAMAMGAAVGVGGIGGPGGGGGSGLPFVVTPPYPHHHLLPTVNICALSREITALRWIGQGGGGAVFQGVWQGASVAVKFLLSEGGLDMAGEMGAVAMEGVVSSVVNHPNVVHTFAFQCSRLTETSFQTEWESCARQDSSLDDQGGPDPFESLLDTNAMYGSGASNMYGSGATPRLGATGGGAGGGGVGPSRLGTMTTAQHLAGGGAAAAVAATAGGDGDGNHGRDSSGDGGDDVRRNERDGGDGRAPAPQGTTAATAPPAVGEDDDDRQRRVAQAARMREKARAGGGGGAQRQQALESTFQSEEGFGDPDIAASARGWTVLQALTYLKARPGMLMTYIIMEYCDRGSLLSAIKRGIFRMDDDAATAAVAAVGGAITAGSSPPHQPAAGLAAAAAAAAAARFPRRIILRAVLRTARDVAQGMSHLHANGIIHGDLKPGNVLLRGCRTDRRGFVAMVADFGLSKVTMGERPLESHHWSTVTVMAPEVIMGRWLKASDVFAFGMLLWQLVTSEPVPYGKLTVPQILMGVAQGTLKPEWPASCHPALSRLGRACLATSPEKRPSFEAIVKVLTKIEKHVRNELRLQKAVTSAGGPELAAAGAPVGQTAAMAMPMGPAGAAGAPEAWRGAQPQAAQ